MQKPVKNRYVGTRVSEEVSFKFQRRALKHGNPGEVLRELIEAFIENRITISPPTNVTLKESLYVTGK